MAKKHVADAHSRQRIADLIAADVAMSKIEDIMRLPRVVLLREYGDLFEESAGPSSGAVSPLWAPSPDELRQIEEMAGMGITSKEIAVVLGVPKALIEARCSHILARASVAMNMRVGANLYRMATGDPKEKSTVTAAIWWSKARMNWQESTKVETSGTGNTTQVQVQIVLPSNGRDDTTTIDGNAEHDGDDGDLMLEGYEQSQEELEN